MSLYLGIDTSAYTTSVALTDGFGVVLNKKLILPVAKGERGLRQADAVFAHIKNLSQIIDCIRGFQLEAVGYSAYPRDISDSYMPCFEAGAVAAKAIAAGLNIPVYPFSHQKGHIEAACYSASFYSEEFLAFHVSGGTTELLYISEGNITRLGGTIDLNAGQAIDRIGVKLGLKFPCGPELEKLAEDFEYSNKIKINVNGFDCNISGSENIADSMMKNGCPAFETAAFILEFVKFTIDKMTENALNKYPGLPVLYAGGVMSCRRIKTYIEKKYNAYFAKPEFSTDNAFGTALLCAKKHDIQINTGDK